MGSTFSDRRGLWAFLLGAVLVTGGVVMHAPMFLMGRSNHFSAAASPPTGSCRGISHASSPPARTTFAALILAWLGKETRGRDLRDLDPDGRTFAATGM